MDDLRGPSSAISSTNSETLQSFRRTDMINFVVMKSSHTIERKYESNERRDKRQASLC